MNEDHWSKTSNAMGRNGAIAGYLPYFYHLGLQQIYASPTHWRRRSDDDAHTASYRFSDDGDLRRHFDHRPTVEQIIARGYLAVPASDPAMAIIEDRARTSWLGLDDVISQVRRRYEIYARTMFDIDDAICAAANAIYQHEAYVGPGSATSKQHYAKHKAVQDLYEQKREARVTLWKDVSRLRTLLPENAQAYLSSHRKRAILAAEPGDAP